MSSVEWTPQQRQAIREVDRDVLLTAAAGSGKTAVLAQRCVYLLTDAPDPCEIDQLLVLTFTEAAAAEMRRRISEVLHSRVQEQPNNRRLQRQLILLDQAHISTIHAFGRSLVQEFFYLLSVDPAFDVLDATEAGFLKTQIARDLFEEVYEQLASRNGHSGEGRNPGVPKNIGSNKTLDPGAGRGDMLSSGGGGDDLRRLVDVYGSDSGDQSLVKLIIELHDFLNSLGDRTAWLEQWQQQQIAINEGQINRLDIVQRQSLVIGRELERVIATLAYAMKSIERFPAAQFYEAHLEEKLLAPLRGIQEALRAGNLEGSVACLKDFAFARLPSRGKGVAAEETEPVKHLIDQAKKTYQALSEKYGLAGNEVLQQLRFTRPFVNEMLELNEEFSRRYREQKRRQNVLDFDDLEVLSLELLHEPKSGEVSEVAWLLHQRYRYILVDEYQDVSPVQDALITRISAAGRDEKWEGSAQRFGHLFRVGDTKQSIYGFRQADPDIFLEKSRDIREGSQAAAIELHKNFRSTKKVLEGINVIFNRCMRPALSGVDYAREAQLYFGADYYDSFDGADSDQAAIELHLIEKKASEPLAQTNATEREATIVGRRIAALFEQPYWVLDAETKQARGIRYSDIVILLRSPGNQVHIWEEVLGKMRIPVYAKLSGGFLQATEIQDVLSLLKVLDNVQQDIPLAAVLRSPLVGLTDSQLLAIRCGNRDGSYVEAVESYLRQGEDSSLKAVLCGFMERLENWRERLRFGTVAELLWGIYQQTHYLSFVRGMVGGKQRQANVLSLHDLACHFENVSRQGLSSFLRYIERMEEEQADLSPAAVLTSADNVVRIMSIHKSKGLEFPVVIVANLDRKFNPRDRNQAVLFNRHNAGSLGLRIIDPVSQDRWASLEHHLVADDIEHRQLAEEMRLLYVAMTRARQRLILTASVNLGKMRQQWQSGSVAQDQWLPDFAIQAAKRPMDWIGMSLAGHVDLQPFLNGESGAMPTQAGACFVVKTYDGDEVVKRCQQGQADAERAEPKDLEEIIGPKIDPAVQSQVDEVAERIAWKYPDEPLTRLSARTSVTDLKHHAQVFDLDDGMIESGKAELGKGFLQRPRFFSGKGETVSGADRGSWTHIFLQRIEFKPKLDRAELAGQLDEMVRQGIFTETQSDVIDLENMERFFNDSVGHEILAAGNGVGREWPFTLALPAQEVYNEPDLPEGETVIVRGIIDCLYETPAGMVIVDYKTDVIELDQLAGRAESYFVPMRLYDRAVTAILHKPIAKRVLYFLHLGQAFEVP